MIFSQSDPTFWSHDCCFKMIALDFCAESRFALPVLFGGLALARAVGFCACAAGPPSAPAEMDQAGVTCSLFILSFSQALSKQASNQSLMTALRLVEHTFELWSFSGVCCERSRLRNMRRSLDRYRTCRVAHIVNFFENHRQSYHQTKK